MRLQAEHRYLYRTFLVPSPCCSQGLNGGGGIENKLMTPVCSYRLKDLTSLLEKQHELIKLIIQKMEIISETEDEDNHCSFQDKFKKERLEQMHSKWNFVLNAVKSKPR